MTNRHLVRSLGLFSLLALTACVTGNSTDSGVVADSGARDVAIDHGRTDAGSDVPVTLDAPHDAPVATDVPVMDAVNDTGVADTGSMDSTTVDTVPVNSCVAAGGACVPLVPGSCPPPGMIGSAGTYSCGGGLGVECCLPGDAGTPPVDAGSPDTGVVTCMSAGGSCVALVPGSCPAPRMIGSASMYSCGGGLGVECCLPAPATDAGTSVTCVSAGGMCVGLFPGACPAPAMVGDARMYTCGGGLGLECCLPGTTTDAGGPPTCASAGGTCVPLVPGSCPAPSMVGSGYTCGSGLGVECCLPAASDAGTSAAPQCLHTGTPTEGWYSSTGVLLCTAMCAGLPAPACQRTGAAQGWYTTSGHGCPPYSTLIVHDAMCM